MATDSINKLPEEILLYIFEHLDSLPPSQLKSRQEPSLRLTSSDTDTHPYKDISLVSSRWRRIVLPLLFSFSCLRLDIAPKPHWSDDNHGLHNGLHLSAEDTPAMSELATTDASVITHRWASRFHHALNDYLTFVQTNNLSRSIRSFVLSTDRMLHSSHQNRFPHRTAATRDHRYQAAAELWRRLYSVVSPARIAIVASPADLACLTNCAIDCFGDWAFADMSAHVLELSIDPQPSLDIGPVTAMPLEYVPQEYPGIAESSILKFWPWSRLALNEGSFLKAYGTYEYFERGPPSLIYSIKDLLASSRSLRMNSRTSTCLTALRSFTYTAILPFANHLDFRGLLPYIEELDVKLAPDPDSGILNDKERIGKAELEDCWQELLTSYRLITRPFATMQIRPDGTPKLKRFICRDMQIKGLQQDLDEEFIPLCLPVWVEREPGVFTRHSQVAEYGPWTD